MSHSIVILQDNPARAEDLASNMRTVSQNVFTVWSLGELRRLASRFPIQVGVVDLGVVTFQDVARLRLQLGMEIVCTHRLPDEIMWAEALAAGALDCCFDGDAPGICRVILQKMAA